MVLNLRNFIEVAIVWILIIPELLYSIHREKREYKKPDPASLTEQFGRYASMILMVLPLGVWEFGFKSSEEMILYFVGNGILLLGYIFVYILFFKKPNFWKAMFLAVTRVLVFILCGIILRHWFLVVFAVIFAIGHFAVTIKKFKEA